MHFNHCVKTLTVVTAFSIELALYLAVIVRLSLRGVHHPFGRRKKAQLRWFQGSLFQTLPFNAASNPSYS
jgi:hypothetical protein